MSSFSPTLEDYRGFAETVPESVLIVNSSGEVVFANSAARVAFLCADNEFYARYVYELVPAQWRAGHDQRMRSFMDHPSPPKRMTVSDVPALRSDDTTFRISIRLQQLKLQEGQHVLAICHDVTERVETELELRSELRTQKVMANSDSLTSLANLRHFKANLDNEIERCARHQCPFALVYFDLDNFKPINDEMGHAEGDRVLRTVASVLKQRIRIGDMAARLGGDEFAILLPDTGVSGAQEFTRAISQALDAAMGSRRWPVSFSIGVATFVQPPPDPNLALQFVDELMYQAKESGKGKTEFRSYI